MKDMWYVAHINPIPWTAPQVAVGRKGGKVYPQVYSSEELKNFKMGLADAIEKKYPDAEVIEDELALEFFFYRSIDTEASNKRRKTHIADATNLQKAAEDALQGILFANDRQVVGVTSWIMEQSEEATPCIVIRVIWHPRVPRLPESVLSQIGDAPELFGVHENEHDVPVGDFF